MADATLRALERAATSGEHAAAERLRRERCRAALPGVPLRPYQIAALGAVEARYAAGERAAVIQLPTGTGKTVLGLELARRTGRTLWLAHRAELIAQPVERLRDMWPGCDVGIVAADRDEPAARDLVVASTPTLMRAAADGSMARLERVLEGGLDLVVADEAHHYAGDSSRAFDRPLLAVLARTGAKLLGLTATPDRADGVGLGVFGAVAYSLQLREAIAAGYLAPFAGFRRVRVEALRYSAEELQALARGGRAAMAAEADLLERVEREQAAIVEATAGAWIAHARRADGSPRRGVVFCVALAQAAATAAALRARGVRAELVSGETPATERRRLVQALRSGDLAALVNCAVLTEGFDAPAIDCVLLARPCASRGLFLQAIGRATRLAPGKADWLVIDLGGGSDQHGLEVAPLLDGNGSTGQGRTATSEQQAPRRLLADRPPPEPVRWLEVEPGLLAAAAGERATVAVRETGGRHAVEVLRGRSVERVGSYNDHELALGVGADAVRRLGGGGWSDPRRQQWRGGAASLRQVEALRRWGVEPPSGVTRGEASDLLLGAVVRAALRRRR